MNDQEQAELTARQRDVLHEIARLETQGEAVTTARIGGNLGIPRQNVRTYLLALQDQLAAEYATDPAEDLPLECLDG